MAQRSVTSQGRPDGDRFADLAILRPTILGAAALGFLSTFILIDHEIAAFKDAILPLLVILPAYLFLMSLNTWWAAQTMANQGLIGAAVATDGTAVQRVVKACCGLAFGVFAALWYVHSVSR